MSDPLTDDHELEARYATGGIVIPGERDDEAVLLAAQIATHAVPYRQRVLGATLREQLYRFTPANSPNPDPTTTPTHERG